MFLSPWALPVMLVGFPRASGDVPGQLGGGAAGAEFSPRERGCSPALSPQITSSTVFPARAGMFPEATPHLQPPSRFPRASGDVPNLFPRRPPSPRFSPRERGCSEPS